MPFWRIAVTRNQIIDYNFEWDSKKAQSNLGKHGISFEQATQVFWDSLALTILDEVHSEDEDRWITMGKSNDDLLIVAHTFKEESPETFRIRIISTRKATRQERKQYEEVGR